MKKKKVNIFGQYTQIPNALFLDERLPSHCINIYAVLQVHAGVDGRIFPSYGSIAEITHLHRSTVIRLMKVLVLYGYVAKETRYSADRGCITSNYYYLNPNPKLLCGKNAIMKMTVAKTMFLKGLACPIISLLLEPLTLMKQHICSLQRCLTVPM